MNRIQDNDREATLYSSNENSFLPLLSSAKPRSFPTLSGTVAALEWHSGQPRRILSIHGWLDNVNSFAVLAPQLNNAHTIAIDCAGHGKSYWRSQDSDYSIWRDLFDILDIVKQLGWDQFELLGHSRGGGIAMLLAGAFPQLISCLHLIEGGVPSLGKEQNFTEAMHSVIESRCSAHDLLPTAFSSRKKAIDARANNDFPISLRAAELLAERSLNTDDKGNFYWKQDQKLKLPTLYLTAKQITNSVESYQGPVNLFLGTSGLQQRFPQYTDLLKTYRQLATYRFEGGHHLHLDPSATPIAEIIRGETRHLSQ